MDAKFEMGPIGDDGGASLLHTSAGVRSIHATKESSRVLEIGVGNAITYQPIGIQSIHLDRKSRRRKKLRTCASHFTACFLVWGMVLVVILVPIANLSSFSFAVEQQGFGYCEADGSFNTGIHPVDSWSTSQAFHITLGFGAMAFSTAKLIDIMWDVVGARPRKS